MDELVDRANGGINGRIAYQPALSRKERALAWLDLLFLDHGLLRLFYSNRHRVTERLWRSAQPTPHGLRREKRRGIRTILCVRGYSPFRPWPLEEEACRKLGLDLHRVHIRGRDAPKKSELLALIDLLSSVQYPVLVHCKSGADRSGFVASVYLLAIEGRSVEEALAQLSLRYGHLRSSRAGILREVLKAYRDDGAAHGLDFRQWVEAAYDRNAVIKGFRPRPFVTAIADQLLRREG